ncbi:MAG: lysylphosphatidylglycerol synthase transmembrane domain-containing protein [Nanoarchaeota archaeon]
MKLKHIFKGVAFFAVLALIAYAVFQMDLSQIMGNIMGADPAAVLGSGLSILTMILLWHLIWDLALRSIKKVSYLRTLPVMWTGILFNTLTPSANFGGEPLRAYYMKKLYGGKKSRYLASILFQKILNYVGLISTFLVSLLLVSLHSASTFGESVRWISAFTLGILAAIVLLFAVSHAFRPWIFRLISKFYSFFKHDRAAFQQYLHASYSRFYSALKNLMRTPSLLFLSFLISVTARLMFILASYLAFLAIGHNVPFRVVFLVVSIGAFAADIPIVPGGIGVTEGTLVLVYTLAGIPAPVATAGVLLMRLLYYIIALGGGFLSWVHLSSHYGKRPGTDPSI